MKFDLINILPQRSTTDCIGKMNVMSDDTLFFVYLSGIIDNFSNV